MMEFRRKAEKPIAEKYEVTPRTLWNWKRSLEKERRLSALFHQRLNDLLNRDWAGELDDALLDAIGKMRELIDKADSLEEVTGAFRALAEVGITREVLRGATHAQPGTSDRAPDAATEQDPAKFAN